MSRFALAALSAALISGSAAAQTAPATPDQSSPPGVPAPRADAALTQALDRYDTNDDGKISLTEWTAAGRQERGFRQFDTDSDGFIVMSELRAASAMMARMRAQRGQ